LHQDVAAVEDVADDQALNRERLGYAAGGKRFDSRY
jgi:hypothetical protein